MKVEVLPFKGRGDDRKFVDNLSDAEWALVIFPQVPSASEVKKLEEWAAAQGFVRVTRGQQPHTYLLSRRSAGITVEL